MDIKEKTDFLKDLEYILNLHGIDNLLNTPDYILKDYLIQCLEAYKTAKEKNDDWHQIKLPIDFEEDIHAIRITQANYDHLKETNKINPKQLYFIVEKPEDENYVEI